MRPQRLTVLAIVLLTFGIGVWLQWAVLTAIGIGVGIAALSTSLLRFPIQASWTDIDVPVRLSRNDTGSILIEVSATPGPGHWLSATTESTGERVYVDNAGSTQLSWPIDTSKRGLQLAGPTILEASDPFGLRRRVFATRDRSAVLVVPRVSPVENPQSLQLSPDALESRLRGSDTFESLREYVTGDPLKLVHWKASARAGELMVRRNVDTHLPRLMVVLDVQSLSYGRRELLHHRLDEQGFERAVDLTASACWYACTPTQRVLLATNGPDSTTLDIDLRDRDSALDFLATIQPSDEVHAGNHRLALLVKETQPHSVVFVSGPIAHISQPTIAALRQMARVTVRRVDPS